MTKDNVSLGTSGWSYKEWEGPFYEKGEDKKLRAYSRVFSTAEIDSTFYRYPSKGMVMGWLRYSPSEFLFTAKVPKLITHNKKLGLKGNIKSDLEAFFEVMRPLQLGGKLACFLIQLPPGYAFNLENLESFFGMLDPMFKYAVEFRNFSWMREETWDLLRKYNVAYVNVDEPLLPPEVHLTAKFSYFRWHGRGTRPWFDYEYTQEQLKEWVPRVENAAAKVEKTYGFFNNHYRGNAVKNCLQLLEMLGKLTPEQAEVKAKVDEHFKKAMLQPELGAFEEPPESSFEGLLRGFIDVSRLEKAKAIDDNELMINLDSPERVEAEVREYHIIIDFTTKTILHDCADWNKGLPAKRFCKHIGKLFLSLKRQKATALLENIKDQKESWQFRPYAQ